MGFEGVWFWVLGFGLGVGCWEHFSELGSFPSVGMTV